jgi:acyl-coenzyme A synthetase/AMP-(fatty) acid ligase
MKYFLNINKINTSKVILADDNVELTCGELLSFIEQFKNKIPERSLVFLFSENTVISVSYYLACLQAKVVPLILGVNTDFELTTNLINTYTPNYLILPEKIASKYHGEIIWNTKGYSVIKLNLDKHEMYSELALLLPTSGSTGSSKLVRHSYVNIESSASNVSSFFELNDSDKAFMFLPMYYTMGLSIINSYLKTGASVLLTNASLTDSKFWSSIKTRGITSITGVPYSFEIFKKMRFFNMKFPDLKILTQGGGKLSEDLYNDCVIYAQNNNIKFIPTYGQTEGTARLTYLDPKFSSIKRGSIGKSIPNGLITIIDENGIEINENYAEGEMIFKGQNVTLGYAVILQDLKLGDEFKGVLYTGDIVKRDEDGFLFITGRKSRFLKLYGIRVSLDEIENLIVNKFDIECIAAGNDTMMKVYVVDYLKTKEIEEFISNKTGLYHKSFQVIPIEKIPRSETGKVIYNILD